jgi:hypothetical protein
MQVSTAIAAQAVPIQQRRTADGPRFIAPLHRDLWRY